MAKLPRTDVWLTPDDVYRRACNRWHVTPQLDAASHEKFKKCAHCITAEQNALTTEWLVDGKPVPVWLNPPNSLLTEFTLRAFNQWEKYNMPILIIMPMQAMTNTQVNDKIWQGVGDGTLGVYGISPRVAFMRIDEPNQSKLSGQKQTEPVKKDTTPQAYGELFFRVRP